MGGVISAGAVAFGPEPRTQQVLAGAMLRGSIMGSATLGTVNLISAWSCSQWATNLSGDKSYMAGNEVISGAVTCLSDFCYSDNMLWAFVACLSAILGAGAAIFRNLTLARLCLLIFVARGCQCFGVTMWALIDSQSCAYWALSKTYWIPVVTFANVTAFSALTLRFARSLIHPEPVASKGQELDEIDNLDDLDWVGHEIQSTPPSKLKH